MIESRNSAMRTAVAIGAWLLLAATGCGRSVSTKPTLDPAAGAEHAAVIARVAGPVVHGAVRAAVPGSGLLITGGESSTGVNGESGAGTLTIPAPADVAAGDFLLAQITFEKGADIDNLAAPSDWIPVRRTNSIDPVTGTDLGQAIFYKVATASGPGDYTWQFLQGSVSGQVRAAGGITRYQGVNLLHPHGPIVGSSGGSGDGTMLTAPGIETSMNSVLVALFGHKKLTVLSNPADMVDVYHVQHGNQSGPTIRSSREVRAADGATGARMSVASDVVGGDKWVAQLVALRSNTIPAYAPPADQDADEGENKAFRLGGFVDPDAHPSWEITVDWGDGTSPEVFTHVNASPADPFAARDLGSRNHTYADNRPGDAPYTVTVTVNDGTDSDTDTFEIVVKNVAPAVTAPAGQAAAEGEDKAFALGSFSDPGVNDAAWTVDVDWGDGATESFSAGSQGSLGTRNHTYADNQTGDAAYTVTVKVTDKDGGVGTASFAVGVANEAPVVTAAANQSGAAGVAKAFALGSFSDAGANDAPWTVDVNWGDNSTAQFTAGTQGSLGSQSHTYAAAGTFTVTVKVTDKDGAVGQATFTVTVDAAGFTYYLHNRATQPSTATTSLANLPMNATLPTNAGSLPNYDTDRDAFVGRLIQKGNASPVQTDLTKYQNWVSPAFGAAFVIDKATNAEVRIWTAMKDLGAGPTGRVRVWIRDCSSAMTGCVVCGEADYTRPAGAGFSQATISVPWTFSGATRTVAAGRVLEVKVLVRPDSGDDMWFGYDTVAMPARIRY